MLLLFCCSIMSESLPPHGLQHAKFPCPSLSLGVCSNSGPLSSWCHRTISFSVAPFSSCLQSFPGSGSLPVSQLFASGGQSAGTSASSSVLSVNIQSWFPLGLTALISLLSKGLSRVLFSYWLFNLVQYSHSVMSNSLQPHGLQHARLPCPSPTPRAYSNSCPLSQWCHPTISSSVIPFASCLRSFPASGSFPRSHFFPSGVQIIAVSASASVLPMNSQDWSPLERTGWISLQSKGLSRVFSNTTVQKHQFFITQPSYSPTLTSIHDY